jgi:hypothetical protein
MTNDSPSRGRKNDETMVIVLRAGHMFHHGASAAGSDFSALDEPYDKPFQGWGKPDDRCRNGHYQTHKSPRAKVRVRET